MVWSYIYSIATAPGVIVHELAHSFFCLLTGVKIFKISLFRFDKVAGYVLHAEPQGFVASFLISFGPLIINSYLAMFLFTKLGAPYGALDLLWLWLGVAIGLHAIPSTGDAESLLKNANRNFWRRPLVILFYPLVLVLYILNLLKRIYFDIVYVAALFYVAKNYFINYL